MTKLFILHGWTYYPLETWKPLLDMFSARGIDFEFLKIPGLSDGTDPAWTLEDYVRWLNEKMLAHDKVILYGHSNGGRISMQFAAKYPEKVEKLILEDSAGISPSGIRKLKRDVFKKIAQAGHLFVKSETARNLFYKIIRENDYRRATPNMKKTMSNLVASDARIILEKITAPTLILWGPGDATTPLRDGILMREGIRGSKLIIIKGARHSPHITHPQEVADIVIPFLSS